MVRLVVAVAAGLVLALSPVGPGGHRPAGAQAASSEVDYAPPVDAPVVDPFRPPPKPWLPGNRGIEYATAPGTPVRAAGRGRVTFAGAVAGSLHVTVQHPDGIRTSYSFLASIVVLAGADVARGQVVGTSGARLHVGARRGDTYIDPASLWGLPGPPWVRLVPLGGSDRRQRGVAAARPGPTGSRSGEARLVEARLVEAPGASPRIVRRPWHPASGRSPPHNPVLPRSPLRGVGTG